MYRIIEKDDYVYIGFNKIDESNYFWKYLGLNKHEQCMQYLCAGHEESIKKEIPLPLTAMDFFSLGANCISFLKMPQTIYDQVKHKIYSACSMSNPI